MIKEIEKFAEKYDKYATNYPQIFLNQTPVLKSQAKKLGEFNKRILVNDEFSHGVIDRLMCCESLGTRGEAAVFAITLNYRKDEGLAILEDVLEKNDNPAFAHHLKFAIRVLNGEKL